MQESAKTFKISNFLHLVDAWCEGHDNSMQAALKSSAKQLSEVFLSNMSYFCCFHRFLQQIVGSLLAGARDGEDNNV